MRFTWFVFVLFEDLKPLSVTNKHKKRKGKKRGERTNQEGAPKKKLYRKEIIMILFHEPDWTGIGFSRKKTVCFQ